MIVQGGVTSGLLDALVAEDLPGPGSVFLHVDWSFRAPVRPGDTITPAAEVLEDMAAVGTMDRYALRSVIASLVGGDDARLERIDSLPWL